MAINFDKALGVHQDALRLRSQRAEILASNLANADTPGYKAKDFDFKQALARVNSGDKMGLSRTHRQHIDSKNSLGAGNIIQYRVPMQPDTGDGNTVESQAEMQRFAQNALSYQTTLNFLSRKFKGMITALRGE